MRKGKNQKIFYLGKINKIVFFLAVVCCCHFVFVFSKRKCFFVVVVVANAGVFLKGENVENQISPASKAKNSRFVTLFFIIFLFCLCRKYCKTWFKWLSSLFFGWFSFRCFSFLTACCVCLFNIKQSFAIFY